MKPYSLGNHPASPLAGIASHRPRIGRMLVGGVVAGVFVLGNPTPGVAQLNLGAGIWVGATVMGGLDLVGEPSRFGLNDRVGSIIGLGVGASVSREWRVGVEGVAAGDVGNVQITATRRVGARPVFVKGGLGPAFGRRWDAGLGSSFVVGWGLPLNTDRGAIVLTTGILAQWFGRDVDGKASTYLMLIGVQGYLF